MNMEDERIIFRAPGLKPKLERLAKLERRTISELCRHVLEDYVREHLPEEIPTWDPLFAKPIEEMSEDQIRKEWRLRGLEQEVSFHGRNDVEIMRAVLMVRKAAERCRVERAEKNREEPQEPPPTAEDNENDLSPTP